MAVPCTFRAALMKVDGKQALVSACFDKSVVPNAKPCPQGCLPLEADEEDEFDEERGQYILTYAARGNELAVMNGSLTVDFTHLLEDWESPADNRIVLDPDLETGEVERIDCTRFGSGAYSIPSSVEQLSFETSAKFILAIETHGMFQRLPGFIKCFLSQYNPPVIHFQGCFICGQVLARFVGGTLDQQPGYHTDLISDGGNDSLGDGVFHRMESCHTEVVLVLFYPDIYSA